MTRRRPGSWRRDLGAAAAGLAVGALVLVVGAVWLLRPAAAPGGGNAPVEFRVDEGEGLAPVAARLEDAGLVRSARGMRLLARLGGRDRSVRAGTYLLPTGVSPQRILDDLVAGRVRLRRVTIPEGWRLEQIAAEVERVLGVPAAEVMAAASAADRRAALACSAPTLEGYLYPETYLFADGTSASEIVRAMTDRFLAVWSTLPDAPAAQLGRHETVTLASIIEAETPLTEERARVAAVYRNRLDRGWLLQADPTVRYGLGKFAGRLLYEHLDIETPWNTYREPGLPPGPIGSPGRSALEAARAPLDRCEDMFFVASGDGGHIFSRTKAEHDRARREFRKRAGDR